jgi:hypothetical protein
MVPATRQLNAPGHAVLRAVAGHAGRVPRRQRFCVSYSVWHFLYKRVLRAMQTIMFPLRRNRMKQAAWRQEFCGSSSERPVNVVHFMLHVFLQLNTH